MVPNNPIDCNITLLISKKNFKNTLKRTTIQHIKQIYQELPIQDLYEAFQKRQYAKFLISKTKQKEDGNRDYQGILQMKISDFPNERSLSHSLLWFFIYLAVLFIFYQTSLAFSGIIQKRIITFDFRKRSINRFL